MPEEIVEEGLSPKPKPKGPPDRGKIKYELDTELEAAWYELDQLPIDQLNEATVQLIARNHQPTSAPQILGCYNENQWLLWRTPQDGRLMIDSMAATITQHIAEQIAQLAQNKLQAEQMRKIRSEQDKIVVAPPGAFDKK